MAWLTGWSYRKAITLSRASGLVENYQMPTYVGLSASSLQNDSNTKVSLLMDGADASTTFTDDAVGGTHTWTASGNAQIDTSDRRFGSGSGLFDGNGDFIWTPDSDDFDFGTGDFTFEFWVKFNNVATYQTLFSQRADADNLIEMFFYGASDDSIRFMAKSGATTITSFYTGARTQNTDRWNHIVVERYGDNPLIFINGVSQAVTEATAISGKTLPNIAANARIGGYAGGTYWMYGRLDTYRIHKGIAKYTANFTPPDAPDVDVHCENHAASDFDDIRFTTSDGTTLLDYWIEQTTGNGMATIWVEYDSIGTTDTTFYMYYGKADASAVSNGANTFIAFDDFERGVDTDEVGGIWTEVGGTIEISTVQKFGGTRAMRLKGASGVAPQGRCNVTASDNIGIRFRFYKETNETPYMSHSDGTNRLYVGFPTNNYFNVYNGASWVNQGIGTIAAAWMLIEFNGFVWASATADCYRDSTPKDNVDISYADATHTNQFYFTSDGTVNVDGWVDNFIVRHFRPVEPEWGSWGAEEGEPAGGGPSEMFMVVVMSI